MTSAGGQPGEPALIEADLGGPLPALDAGEPFVADVRDEAPVDSGVSSPALACDAPGELAAEGGRCYWLGAGAVTWGSASAACAEAGGTLARVESPEDEALLLSNGAGDLWIGLNDIDVEGEMRWDGGAELAAYRHWAAEQPDDFDGSEDCVALLADGRGWNDRPCADQRPFVCER